MADWRRFIEPGTRTHLEAQLKEIAKYKGAYMRAENPANAQLWCGLAFLSKQIFDLNLRMNYLERALKDITGKRAKEGKKERKEKDADPAKALHDVLRKFKAGKEYKAR